MKNLLKTILATSLLFTGWQQSYAASNSDKPILAQSYALYQLYHPAVANTEPKNVKIQFANDYASLFKKKNKVSEAEFIAFEQSRLQSLMQQRREMSLKQAYVRFGILDSDKNGQMTLKEFQNSGVKTFDGMDKNQDGMIHETDVDVNSQSTRTHDGFAVRLPISMPMANTVPEFIEKYGQGKAYTTLGAYLIARDQQFKDTDLNQDRVVTEKEYIDEFIQRFDANATEGMKKMNDTFSSQFKLMSKSKNTIASKDIKSFAQNLEKVAVQSGVK